MRAGGCGRGRGMGRWAGARAHAAERLASRAVCCGHCCLGCTQPDPLPTLLSPQPWRPGRFSPLVLPLCTLPWHWSHRDVTRTLPCTPRPAGEGYLRNTRALLVRASLMQHDLIQVPPCWHTCPRCCAPGRVCLSHPAHGPRSAGSEASRRRQLAGSRGGGPTRGAPSWGALAPLALRCRCSGWQAEASGRAGTVAGQASRERVRRAIRWPRWPC